MNRDTLESMYEAIRKEPNAFSTEALIGWIISAHEEITYLEEKVTELSEFTAGASI